MSELKFYTESKMHWTFLHINHRTNLFSLPAPAPPSSLSRIIVIICGNRRCLLCSTENDALAPWYFHIFHAFHFLVAVSFWFSRFTLYQILSWEMNGLILLALSCGFFTRLKCFFKHIVAVFIVFPNNEKRGGKRPQKNVGIYKTNRPKISIESVNT